MDPRIYDDDALALLYPTANAQSRQGVFVSRALQSQTYGNLGMAAEAEYLHSSMPSGEPPDIPTIAFPTQPQVLGANPTNPQQLSWAGSEPWSAQTAVPQHFESPADFLSRVEPEGDSLEPSLFTYPSGSQVPHVPHIPHDSQWPALGATAAAAAATSSVISSSDAAYLAARGPSLTMGTTAPSMGREGSNYSMFGGFQGLNLGSRTSDSVADQTHGDTSRQPLSPTHAPYHGRGRDSVDLACLGAAVDPTRLPPLMENSLTEDLCRTSSMDSRISSASAEQRLQRARQQHIENSRKQPMLQPARTQPPPPASRPARTRALSESHGNSRRGKSSKMLCRYCQTSCRGLPELERHMKRDHSSRKTQFQIVDPRTGAPLPGCKRCAAGKRYNTNYNAAEHLRRIHSEHLREVLPTTDARETSSSRWPPMELLRPWLRKVTTNNDTGGDDDDSEDELALEAPPRPHRRSSRQSQPPVAVRPASTDMTSTDAAIFAASRQYAGETYSQFIMGGNHASLHDTAEACMPPAAPDNPVPLVAAGGTHVDIREQVDFVTPAAADPCMPDFLSGDVGASFAFGISAYSDDTDPTRLLGDQQDPTWDYVNFEL